MKLSLNKHERLKSKRVIDRLFAEGNSFNVYPIKVVYQKISHGEAAVPVMIGVTVSKKNFKKAVDRNLIKRRLREAYRINKTSIVESIDKNNSHYVIMLIYIAKEILHFDIIEKAVKTSQQRIIRLDNNAS